LTEVGTSFAAAWIQPEQDSRGPKKFCAKLEELSESIRESSESPIYGDANVAASSLFCSFRRQESISETDQNEDKPDEEKCLASRPSLYLSCLGTAV
jgi:hypothetical protein